MNKKLLALLLVGAMAGNVYAADVDSGTAAGVVGGGDARAAAAAAGAAAMAAQRAGGAAPLLAPAPAHDGRGEAVFNAGDRANLIAILDALNSADSGVHAKLGALQGAVAALSTSAAAPAAVAPVPGAAAAPVAPAAGATLTGKDGWKGPLSWARSMVFARTSENPSNVFAARAAGVKPANWAQKAEINDADATDRGIWKARVTRGVTLAAYAMLIRSAAGTLGDFFSDDEEDEEGEEDNA